MTRLLIALTLAAAVAAPLACAAADAAPARSAWLVDRALDTEPGLDRAALPQSDIGGFADLGGGGGVDRTSVAKPMLLSLLVPGLGEATMGYRRGYLMMALDAAAWVGVAKYHQDGVDKRELYYDYLDEHWSQDRLAAAFGGDANDYPGTYYYGVNDHEDLSLWVSREDDEREWYENAGKWDQFVFGWDDFLDPRILYPGENIQAGDTSYFRDNTDVSPHRMIYREMRQDSNDAFHTRDNLVYFNMLTRVFSVLQVAWLGGVFSDDGQAALSVGGHDVAIIAEPRGFTASRLGFSVSY